MKKRKLGKYISIDRTEQWEWAATCGDYSATGSVRHLSEVTQAMYNWHHPAFENPPRWRRVMRRDEHKN